MSFPVTPEQIEAGRKLFARPCVFVAAANKAASLPPLSLPEIAFAGRSNVGKSSLVNALTGRRTLARTSLTPGRTRQLIFFDLGGELHLVDMPGYGFAKAPKTEIKAWTKLTKQFLAGRSSLRRLFLLIDSRRGIGQYDRQMMTELDEAALSWAVILTKMDKIPKEKKEALITKTNEQIRSHIAAFPYIQPSSTQSGEGIAELRGHIYELISL